jgi:hypothetical protein
MCTLCSNCINIIKIYITIFPRSFISCFLILNTEICRSFRDFVCAVHVAQCRVFAPSCWCRGRCRLVLHYLVPSLLFSVLFNIPRILDLTPLRDRLAGDPQYVQFYVGYQVQYTLYRSILGVGGGGGGGGMRLVKVAPMLNHLMVSLA